MRSAPTSASCADVLDSRPSGHAAAARRGARQEPQLRLADHQSGLSDADPGAAPLESIFEICHFSPAERQAFLDAYHAAHPRRLVTVAHGPATRRIAVDVPDLGDAKRNRALDDLIGEMARRLAQIVARPQTRRRAMKKLINAVETVLAESLDGFAAAHADIVVLGDGAQVRAPPRPSRPARSR